jgi:hypothetical protein
MPSLQGLGGYRERLRKITRESNETLMQVVEDLVAVCRDGAEQTLLPDELARRREVYVADLLRVRNEYMLLNQDELLAAAGLTA